MLSDLGGNKISYLYLIFVFTYNGENLAVVDDFVYLGVTFTRNASFVKHKNIF